MDVILISTTDMESGRALLRRLIADGISGADALVAFPDDDCWYPPGFLVQVAALFERDATLVGL